MAIQFPARGQKAPQFWDVQLKKFIDARSVLSRLRLNSGAALAADVPTVTYSSASTWTSTTRLAINARQFLPVVTGVNGDSSVTASGQAIRFRTAEAAVEIGVSFQAPGTGAYRVYVNGLPTTSGIVTPGSPPTVGIQYLKLAFATAAPRVIEVIADLGAGGWLAVIGPINASIGAATPRNIKTAVVGDSFAGGLPAASGPPIMAYPQRAMRDLGSDLMAQSHPGGGYTLPGTSVPYNEAVSIARIAAFDPDLIIVQGSINEVAADPATVTAAATALFDAYADAMPDVAIIATGAMPSGFTPGVTSPAYGAAIKAAALAHPNVIGYLDPLGDTDAGSQPPTATVGGTYAEGALVTYLGAIWKQSGAGSLTTASGTMPGISTRWLLLGVGFYGTGKVGATTGNGNRDVLVYSDNAHPTAAGCDAISAWLSSALLALA